MPIGLNTNANSIRNRPVPSVPEISQPTVNTSETAEGIQVGGGGEPAAVFETSAVARTGPAETVSDFVGSYVNDQGDKMEITMEDGRLKLSGSFKDPNAPNTTIGYGNHMPDPDAPAVTENTTFRHPWIHLGRDDKVETTTGSKFQDGFFTYKRTETRDIQLGRDQRTERMDQLRLNGDTLHMTYARREQEGTLLGWSTPEHHIINVSFRRVQ